MTHISLEMFYLFRWHCNATCRMPSTGWHCRLRAMFTPPITRMRRRPLFPPCHLPSHPHLRDLCLNFMCSEARMKTHLIKWTSCVHGEVAHLSLQMVHWLICSIFSCSFVLLWWHRHLAPLYPTFHYTNHIFSQRISHWQLHFTIPTLSVFPKPVFQKLLRKKYIFLLQTFSSIPSLFFFSSTKKTYFL